MTLRVAAGLVLALLSVPARAELRVFVSVDMEGVAGVATDQQLSPQGFEYARFREFMTAEALAAVRGAKAAGARVMAAASSRVFIRSMQDRSGQAR